MRFISLLVVTAILAITLTLTAQAQAVPWPSISPSYRCDNGLTVFVLANVGIDMQAASQYEVSTPTRLIEQGVFWIASGQAGEWRYNAPRIPLTFRYVRPDTGGVVSLTQTCDGAVPGPTPTPEPTPTPVGTPEFPGGQGAHFSYMPLVPQEGQATWR